jgi:hypothetical protein
MSKCYLLVLQLLIALTSNAQIKKQSFLLGAQLSYYNDKIQFENFNQKSESGTFGFSIGKAFKENSVIGLNFSFSPSKQSNYRNGNDTGTLTYNRFDIGVYFREYKKLAKDLYFFGQSDAAFITANQREDYKISSYDLKASQRGGFIALTPGISYQLFRKMQFELTIPNILSMQYLTIKYTSENPQVNNSKRELISLYSNLNSNTSLGWLGVGFRFLL